MHDVEINYQGHQLYVIYQENEGLTVDTVSLVYDGRERRLELPPKMQRLLIEEIQWIATHKPYKTSFGSSTQQMAVIKPPRL